MAETKAQVLAYGGGVQTVAMCVLVTSGRLPRPDRIVAADTGREARSTWAYLDEHTRPLLAPLGLDVEIAPHSLATVDMYAHNGDLLVPAFTATGKLRGFCSGEWKRDVLPRHLRASGVRRATMWLGISLEERRRATNPARGLWGVRYPLLELMLTRSDCERIILQAGLPLPRKSACFMCPNRSNAEWRQIRDDSPEEWAEAIAIDEEIRLADERGGVWLHQSRMPLADADLDASDRREPARQCGLGMCHV